MEKNLNLEELKELHKEFLEKLNNKNNTNKK